MQARSEAALIHVLLMEVEPEHYDEVVGATSVDAQRLSSQINGFLGFDVYGTDDRRYVLVVSQWTDDVAWSKAQWDRDVQDALVARFTSARAVHSRLYRRV